MSDQQVFVELLVNRILLINLDGQVFAEFLKHLLKDLELHLVDSSKDLNRYSFVNWEHFLENGASVSSENPTGLLILTLLEVDAGESHQILIENLRALLFSKVEAVFPLSTLLQHVQA